jgi:hypothetical protein
MRLAMFLALGLLSLQARPAPPSRWIQGFTATGP